MRETMRDAGILRIEGIEDIDYQSLRRVPLKQRCPARVNDTGTALAPRSAKGLDPDLTKRLIVNSLNSLNPLNASSPAGRHNLIRNSRIA